MKQKKRKSAIDQVGYTPNLTGFFYQRLPLPQMACGILCGMQHGESYTKANLRTGSTAASHCFRHFLLTCSQSIGKILSWLVKYDFIVRNPQLEFARLIHLIENAGWTISPCWFYHLMIYWVKLEIEIENWRRKESLIETSNSRVQWKLTSIWKQK